MLNARHASAQSLEEHALEGPEATHRLAVFAGLAMIAAAIGWSMVSPIDVRAKGTGQVVTASQTQVVQNLEGGLVTEIKVKNGDLVKKGQLLVKLSPTVLEAELHDRQANQSGLEASIIRLQAEARLQEPQFPRALAERAPDVVESEKALHRQRESMLQAQLDVLETQRGQRLSEVNDLKSRAPRLQETLRLINQQLVQTRELVGTRAASPAEVLALEKEASVAKGQLQVAQEQLPGAVAGLKGALERIHEKRETYRAEALQDLEERQIKLKGLLGAVKARADQVNRTQVLSPVDGVVKTMHVNSKGEVVTPGHTIAEIVPTGDALRVEAHILPADIGFVVPGQEVNIRLSAFDYAIFGSLKGKVFSVSPDTVKDETDPRLIYYRVQIRPAKTSLKGPKGPLELKPGMVADVDILTGRRTVWDYVFKPLTRARMEAFHER